MILRSGIALDRRFVVANAISQRRRMSTKRKTDSLSRRTFLKLGVAAGCATSSSGRAEDSSNATTALFDGRTLEGWIQVQNSATAFGSEDIADLDALAKKLTDKPDAVSAFLSDQLVGAVKSDLAASPSSSTDGKAVRSALCKNLNKIISGTSLYEKARFDNVRLRPETLELLKQNPHGRDLVRLNRLLIYDPHEWSRVEILADASTGRARLAVAQPVGSRAQEILDFKNPAAGKIGPIAWQMHNRGLFDEYKDVTLEVNPKIHYLVTVK